MREIEVKILRGSGTDTRKYHTVSVDDNAAVSVMNLLEEIYNKQDHSLAFFSHAACRQAACGKCMVRIDGAVKLACKERVVKDKITLEPYSDKVIRDLVCESKYHCQSKQ